MSDKKNEKKSFLMGTGLSKIIGGFKIKALSKAFSHREKINRSDLGVLKVSFMISALDGAITEAEYKTFELMAKKCRGYTPEAAETALDEAMRSAGYLMLKAQHGTDAELVKAFVAEARAALPDGFAYLSMEDVRRAVVTWVMMGLSDGDYSAREQKCIEAIRKLFAELKADQVRKEAARQIALSPDFAFEQVLSSGAAATRISLVTKDFISEVEETLRKAGDSAEAAKELAKLIQGE